MLGKLAKWTPKTNEDVLEAANRLAQAAREIIEKPSLRSPIDLLKVSDKILGRVLSRKNGVSIDYDYVYQIEFLANDRGIVLGTIHMFRRNRIAEWAMSLRKIEVTKEDVEYYNGNVTIFGYNSDDGALNLFKENLVPLLEKMKWLDGKLFETGSQLVKDLIKNDKARSGKDNSRRCGKVRTCNRGSGNRKPVVRSGDSDV